MTLTSSYTSGSNKDLLTVTFDQAKGLNVATLYGFISAQTDLINNKLSSLKIAGSSVSVTDMFELQLKMNRFSQYSEMITAVVSAAGAAIQSIARNVK